MSGLWKNLKSLWIDHWSRTVLDERMSLAGRYRTLESEASIYIRVLGIKKEMVVITFDQEVGVPKGLKKSDHSLIATCSGGTLIVTSIPENRAVCFPQSTVNVSQGPALFLVQFTGCLPVFPSSQR